MAFRLAKLKSFISNGHFSSENNRGEITSPQLGFNVSCCERTKELKVKVIGARLLPTNFGNANLEGYLVKVKLFPGREKFETACVKEPWPLFSEAFTFPIITDCTKFKEQILGKFVVLTVYVNFKMDNESKLERSGSLRKWFSFRKEDGLRKNNDRRGGSFRQNSLNNRRIVGVVTYNLDPRNFTQKKRQDVFSTPDIWRDIQSISTGLDTHEAAKGNRKGELEVELIYSKSEDGNNDLLQLSLSRLRCSMRTMQEHEKLKGHLYLKMVGRENNEKISKWKSDRFEPTISMKIEPKTALLQTYVKDYAINNVKLIIQLINKNALGKKLILGTITIEKDMEIWKEAFNNSTTPVKKMLCFE